MDQKKKLFVQPYSGLCNQLISIVNAIILAHISDRLLCINGFCSDYNNYDYVPIEEIIDINYLNSLITKLSLSTKIITIFDKNEFRYISLPFEEKRSVPFLGSELAKYILNNENIDIENLNIGYPFHFVSDNTVLENIRAELLKNIKFEKKWYEIALYIKTELKLNEYHTIHLRLEDDMINHICTYFSKKSFDETNSILRDEYTKEISNNEKCIYLCTSLCKYDNTNNNYLCDLKNKYKNIKDSSVIDIRNIFHISGRECLGIIDFILAIESSYFIGLHCSSFSRIISTINTNSKLINPFN